MRRRSVWIIGPGLAIGSATAAIISLAIGTRLSGWWQFVWPVLVIVWSFLVLLSWKTHEINMETIKIQREVIDRCLGPDLRRDQSRWN